MVWNTSAFQLLIISATGGFTGLFVYSGVPGPGNLIASIAPAAGTDPYGNAYKAGVTSYLPGVSFAELVSGSVVLGLSGGTPSVIDALMSVAVLGAGQSLEFSSGTTGANTPSQMFLNDSGSATGAFGPGLQVIDGADGNTYDTERLFLHGTALPQSIATTAATTITGCSKTNLGIGRYRYNAYISFHGAGAAGTARFCIAGTAVTSSFDIAAMFITNTGVANNGTSATFGSGGFVQSPTLTTGANIACIEGELVVSTAGSVALQGFEGTAGDAFTVDNVKFDLWPVVAS